MYKEFMKKMMIVGMFALPVGVSADFYVIPIGKSSINTSDVKSFNSECISSSKLTTTLPYTVPTGKAFVVTSIIVSQCDSGRMYGLIEIGSNYTQYTGIESIIASPKIYSYNIGIVMNEGEQIKFSVKKAIDSNAEVMISVNGYETRP
jgi:hypothetical protein